MRWKKYLSWTGWLLAIVFAVLYFNTRQISNRPQVSPPEYVVQDKEITNDEFTNNVTNNDVPSQALSTLQYVLQNDRAPEGYVGGRKFYNREKQLPLSHNSQVISYREWDVWPKEKGKNRGPERLITGDNKTAYYKNNHYKTFIQIQ